MTRLSLFMFPVLLFAVGTVPADDLTIAPPPREKATPSAAPKMPMSGLTAAKPMFEACIYRYPVGTTNKQCQAFVDQGLGMYYSYVWIEAARAFETALTFDPDCAYAWLMLHRSLEKFGRVGPVVPASPYQAVLGGTMFGKLPDRVGKNNADHALDMARKLMPKASQREQLHIQSRLQEKGIWPNTPPDQRNKLAAQTLDELLMLYEDDEEGWFWRAQVAEGPNGKAPFYKALLKVNPLHPGANHELVHFYEAIKRPALGWPHAEGYIKSSPGIPHAFHMQAHLATRIGKWGPTTDWSWKAIELEKAYHKYQGVTPGEDHQFSHHMDILSTSLVHDGRFADLRLLVSESDSSKTSLRNQLFKTALITKDWDEAEKMLSFYRRNKSDGAYYAALMYLEKGDTQRAGVEVETLRGVQQSQKTNKRLEQQLWEVQGRHLCQSGNGDGLKMLKKLVDATKNDFFHHAWGNGAVYMEQWGIGALECGNATEAEEAFQEALAHDMGSVRGALGLWALCERLGRTEEASRYLKVAQRCWNRAAPADFERLKADMASRASKIKSTSTAATGDE
jgi:tetratricopeptide (TPR) repeat protein